MRDFRFCATGDEDTYTTSSEPVMQSMASFDPDFTIVAGALSYEAAKGSGSKVGGAGLAASTTSGWFGKSGGGDMAGTGPGTPPIEVWGSSQTSMHVRAIDPTQSGSTITSITNEAVMDNVTLIRRSVTGPAGG